MAEVWALLSAALFPVFVTCSGKKKNIEKCKYKLWNLSPENVITKSLLKLFVFCCCYFFFFNCWLRWKCSASSGKWKPRMMLLNAAFILNLINHSNSPKTLNHSLTFYAVYIFLVKYILANACNFILCYKNRYLFWNLLMEKGMLVNIYYLLPLFVWVFVFVFCKFLIAVVSQATAKKQKSK